MRHGKKFNHLGRKSAHRKALLRNLTIALITHKRINTTLAKAKALRTFAEPLVTKAKTNDTHNRRTVFSYLQNKDAVNELFSTVAEKVGDRPGGYLRVIKTGFRLGDGAETAMIEFVDFNEVYNKDADKSKGRTRRSRRRRGGSGNTANAKTETTGTKEAAAATTAAAATKETKAGNEEE
ncbi:large subunit ribosomal protein L17 [Lewinella marina]|uniref:Large ribosomal subunit protein bL17 n=1 Tax=Neolewinella marina TaxID=438751 RepID=A0A2G0CGU1_9BACT|nr:large subunit ribosomal protein L17 [Neolewinella marina]PHK99181.1 50S ribosomal protein L17 [Neolewinella marina]